MGSLFIRGGGGKCEKFLGGVFFYGKSGGGGGGPHLFEVKMTIFLGGGGARKSLHSSFLRGGGYLFVPVGHRTTTH